MKVTIDELVKMDPDDIIPAVWQLSPEGLKKLLEETLDFVDRDKEMSSLEYMNVHYVVHRIFERDPSTQLKDTLSELAERTIQYFITTLNKRTDTDELQSAVIAASVVLHSNPFLRYETVKTIRRLFEERGYERFGK